MQNLFRLSGITSLLSGICLGIWWFSSMFLFFFPEKDLLNNYPKYYLTTGSIISNIFQLLSFIMISITLVIIYFYFIDKIGKYGSILILSLLIGAVLIGGIGFYETFIWPVLANFDKNLLNLKNGPIYTNKLFLVGYTLPLIIFYANLLIFCIAFWKLNVYPLYNLIILIVGALIYIIGTLILPIRYYIQSLGITMMIISFILIGLKNIGNLN